MNFPNTSSVFIAAMRFSVTVNGTSRTIVSVKLIISTCLKIVVSVEVSKQEFCVAVDFLPSGKLLALDYPIITAVTFTV